MKNILRCGINSNTLKTIAIIAMVIDHIGFYFSEALPPTIYIICRGVGRIVMPIFTYLLVQGFFHTKNFKRYVTRMGIFAVITQMLITILMIINKVYIPSYTAARQAYVTGNILFSFVLSLITLKLLHEQILIKKWTYNKNLSLKIGIIAVIFLIDLVLPIDYGIEVLILSILMYYLEKFRIKLLMQRNNSILNVKSVLLNTISEEKIKIMYIGIILLILLSLVIYFNSYWTVLFAVIPISLYNGERGKLNLKYLYYITFPLQHVLLYSLAMIITLT